MELFKTYKKEILKSSILLITLFLISLFIIYFLLNKQEKNFEEKKIYDQTLLYRSTLQGLETLADNTFLLNIDTPQIKKILLKAQDPKSRDQARAELYKLLQPKYELMKKAGTRQLHFHLPGAISFLRFHKPSRYGDDLKNVRYSVELVHKTKKIVRGFEEGRVFNGFRNVYPIFYNDQFIGSVEISYALNGFIQNIIKIQKGYYGLLIKNSVIEQKVWEDEKKHYEPSVMAPNYSWDKPSLEFMFQTLNNFSQSDLENSEKLLARTVQQHLRSHQDFLIHFKCKKGNCIIIFKYIYNIHNEPVAIFVSARYDSFIKQQTENFYILLISGLFFSIFSAVSFFFYLKNNRDLTHTLEVRSITDPLTGLLNRRGFFQSTKHSLDHENSHFSILFLDIDHFKKINDTYGHDTGDHVLELLAKLLRKNLRKTDIITRWGGEEFIVFLENTDLNEAIDIAEKLRKTIENYSSKKLPHFTISIGVRNNKGESLHESIEYADQALYKAKENGRNRIEVS